MTVGQCFNTNTQNKLAPCGMPSFLEGNVMHEKLLTGFKRTLQKLGWHDTQVMPYLKLSMGDSTLHLVSVVAVVMRAISYLTKPDRSVWPCTVTRIGGLGGKTDLVKYPPSLTVDND